MAGNIEYDLDTDTANAWPASKESTPFGQIPVLKHGGLTLAQGGALNRYCARLAGLYPQGIVEASICDMYLEEMMDIFSGLFKVRELSQIILFHFKMLYQSCIAFGSLVFISNCIQKL